MRLTDKIEPAISLFLVQAKVRPAPAHAKFWDWQFGLLKVWITGSDPEDAGERCARILADLNYDVEDGHLLSEPAAADYDHPVSKQCLASARMFGIAFFLHASPTGSSEEEFARITLTPAHDH